MSLRVLMEARATVPVETAAYRLGQDLAAAGSDGLPRWQPSCTASSRRHSGRKRTYARLLIEALEPHAVPAPLGRLVAHAAAAAGSVS